MIDRMHLHFRIAFPSLLALMSTLGVALHPYLASHELLARSESSRNPKIEESESLASDPEMAVRIGRHIFFDTSLSKPTGQACVSCHQPQAGFADPRPVSPGAVEGRTGSRNAPSLMYAALIPGFVYEEVVLDDGSEVYAWEGGLFHDGRAKDLFEQVQQPFFDPNEMNLADEGELAGRLRDSEYKEEFREWLGEELWMSDAALTYHAYRGLVEFLKEPMFRPFDSRIDDYLSGDQNALSAEELKGLEVFENEGRCASCHFLTPASWSQPLLSDFGYDNLGVPSRGKKDPGLGGRTGNADELGQFRAPSLRNVALTAPYMHNGSIESLRDVMEFYNKRDAELDRWGPTDYPETVNHDDLGKLELTDEQIANLVDLMDAFTDRSLLEIRSNDELPRAPAKTPSSEEKRLYFPDWTYRLHPEYPGKMARGDE